MASSLHMLCPQQGQQDIVHTVCLQHVAVLLDDIHNPQPVPVFLQNAEDRFCLSPDILLLTIGVYLATLLQTVSR